MSNRIYLNMRLFVQKSNKIKGFFVKNKKSYKQSIINNRLTNYNKILSRRFHTYEPLFGGFDGGDDPNSNKNNRWIIILGLSLWYIIHTKIKK